MKQAPREITWHTEDYPPIHGGGRYEQREWEVTTPARIEFESLEEIIAALQAWANGAGFHDHFDVEDAGVPGADDGFPKAEQIQFVLPVAAPEVA